MLRRILTEEITTIKSRSIQVLAKLVCYHDLIGDIIAKGRDLEQLETIAGSEQELDMLIALNLADAKAVVQGWYVQLAREVPALRTSVLAKLNATSAPEAE
jgi:UTP:GlnB (protein PII) uridylyltransferase